MATKPRGYTQQPGNVLDYDGLMARALAMPDPQPVDAGKTGAMRGVADVGLSLGQGVIGGAKMLTDLAGADNWVSDNLGRSNAMMQDLYSPGRKAEMQQRQAKIAAADATDSTWDQVTSRLGGIAEAPVQTMAQAAGSMLPIVAANVATGGMASVPGAVGMAARYGLPAALGVGMGVGSVKGQNYEAVLNEAIKRGIPEEEAKALAVKASEYSGQNAPQQALGGAFGMLDSLTGAERLLGNMARKGATQKAVESVDGLMKRTVKGAAEEAWPEGLQGGQGQFAQNQALNNSGFATDPWAGVVGQGINDATVGAMIGAPVGAISGGQPVPKADPFAPPVPPVPPAAPLGPMQRAAAAAQPVATVAAPTANVGGPGGTEVDAIAQQLNEAPQIEPAKVIDGDNPLITHINDATESDRAAYEQAMGEDKKAVEAQDTEKQSISDPTGKYQEAQMSEEDKRAVIFSNQVVADGGEKWSGTQDGDILNGMAAPFKTKMAAMRRVTMEGKDWTIAPVFDGWVARRKDALNVSDANGVQSLRSSGVGNAGTDNTGGVGSGDAVRGGREADAGTNEADSLGQPSELPGGTDAGAVADPITQTVTQNTQSDYANAPNVQNPAPAANDTQAQAAPDQAPEAVASDAAPAADVPGAGNATVEGDGVITPPNGVEQVSQPAQPGTPGEGAGASQPTQAAPKKPGPASLGSAKADMDHLFGLDEKRKKGIERIAKGTAYFATLPKANEFLAKNGLKETHEAVKGDKRWDIRAKATPKPTESTNAKTTKAEPRLFVKDEAEAIASLTALKNDPDATHLKNGNAPGDAKWTKGPKGFSFRQFTFNGQPVQEIQSPSGVIITRGLDTKGNLYEEGESNNKDDLLTGKAFDEFQQYFAKTAPKPDTQRITTDKAEMRPYRKPDGSVGYEAVPIVDEKPAVEKPGTVNVPPTIAEAFTAQMQKQKGRITRLKNEAEKSGSLEDKRAAQLKVTAAEATLRQMRLKIFDAEDAAVKSVEQGITSPFNDFADLFPSAAEEIAKLTGRNDELDAEMQSYEAKPNPTYSGEPARDLAGNVIQRPKLEGADRFQYPVAFSKTDDPAKTAAQARVVDYMNGDIDRPTLIKVLEDSGLEQGTMFAITQRLQNDGLSNGEMDRLLERREKSAKPAAEPASKPLTPNQRIAAKKQAKEAPETPPAPPEAPIPITFKDKATGKKLSFKDGKQILASVDAKIAKYQELIACLRR
jgi:hypothetical protein